MRGGFDACAEILRRGYQALTEIRQPEAIYRDARRRGILAVHDPLGETEAIARRAFQKTSTRRARPVGRVRPDAIGRRV